MKRTSRILYHFSGQGALTGSPRALLTMIDSLDRDRFEPAFLGASTGPLADELGARKVEIIDCRVASASWREPLTSIMNVREKRRLLVQSKVDIVHMNESGWNSDLVLAARLAGVPVALHLHNPAAVLRRNLNFTIARKVFLCSRAQASQIENFDRIKERSVVLHNAVDIDYFAKGHSIRHEIGLTNDEIVIGTVAQVGHRKGSDLFLDTAERLLEKCASANLKFVMVGPPAVGEDAYFRSIMGRLQQGRLKESVTYLGGRTDIPNVLASLDIFFLPTRAEPFGMVIIEAMAAGLPVVATAVGGIPEIITDDEIGRMVSTTLPAAFEAAIVGLLDRGEGRKIMGERARKSLYGRFDLRSMGEHLRTVYEELNP